MEYYVFVSNNCNLNCSYCSIMVDAKQFNLPLEPIYKIEELFSFIKNTQKQFESSEAEIVFFGGEPTLNYSFIYQLIQYIETHEKNFLITYMLHTNGLLLDKIPSEILFKLNAILVSINYLEMPKYNLFKGYFCTVVKGIKTIKQIKKDIPIVGRLTITENSSLYNLIMQLHPFFDYIYWQLENCYKFKDFSTFYKSYKYELELLEDIWSKYLQHGILLNLIPFISTISFINENKFPTGFCCGYNQSMLYIQTDGQCYTCAEDFVTNKNLVGNIYNGITFPNFTLDNTKCKSCNYLNICKGRCGRMHKEFSFEHVNEYCKLNQLQFDYFKENIKSINKWAFENNIKITTDAKLFNYTEYTP